MKGTQKLQGVNKNLVAWIEQFEKDNNFKMSSEGVVIVITYGLRTLEEQKELLAKGLSKTLKSKHLTGNAIDIAFEKNGKIDWSDKKWYAIANTHFIEYFKRLGIKVTWGGTFKFANDMYHFQIDTTPDQDMQANTLIQKGDKGEIVKQIQTLLMSHGFNLGKFGADGDYGDATVKAVEDFQKSKGLLVDGKVGFKTLNALKGI